MHRYQLQQCVGKITAIVQAPCTLHDINCQIHKHELIITSVYVEGPQIANLEKNVESQMNNPFDTRNTG